ncbi:hypothetical protein EV1_022465 [Malus domestica]
MIPEAAIAKQENDIFYLLKDLMFLRARLACLGAKAGFSNDGDTRAGLVVEDSGAQFMANFSIDTVSHQFHSF